MSGQGLAGGTPGSRIFVTYFRELDLGPWAACPQPPTDRLWGGGLAQDHSSAKSPLPAGPRGSPGAHRAAC